MKEYITKKEKDITIGDVKLTKDSSTCYSLRFEFFQDYDGSEVVSEGVQIMPGHAIKGGCQYMSNWRKPKGESEISKFIQPEDAKKARLSYNQYLRNVKRLFDLYYYSIFSKDKEVIPLYYIDDTHLNVDLKEGDIICTVSENDGLVFTVLKDNEYNKCTKEITQDELFYEWLTETGKEYAVYLHGYVFTIGNYNKTLRQLETSHTYYLSAKPGKTYLVKGFTMNWLSDRIINITKKFYDELYEIYKQYSDDKPITRTIGHINGKKYISWEVPEDVIKGIDDGNEIINRTEA